MSYLNASYGSGYKNGGPMWTAASAERRRERCWALLGQLRGQDLQGDFSGQDPHELHKISFLASG